MKWGWGLLCSLEDVDSNCIGLLKSITLCVYAVLLKPCMLWLVIILQLLAGSLLFQCELEPLVVNCCSIVG